MSTLCLAAWFLLFGGSLEGSAAEQQAKPLSTRAARIVEQLDALVASRNYTFIPVSVSALPDGVEQSLGTYYYFLSVEGEALRLHLPTIEPQMSYYTTTLDLELPAVENYSAQQQSYGWHISFGAEQGGVDYVFDLYLYTANSHVVMTLGSSEGLYMKYLGSLSSAGR